MTVSIPINQFKLHCVEIIEQRGTDKQTIIITKRNKPIATVRPFYDTKDSLFGMLKNKAEIKSDITAPIENLWDAENE